MKKFFKILSLIVCTVLLAVIVYVAYVFISFHRIGDMPLTPEGQPASESVEVGKEYSFLSYNIGFGAYESDYGFFMDGGKESRAWSKERLEKNLNNISSLVEKQNSDFAFIQEVDIGSTRSYGVDERPYFSSVLKNYSRVFAQNYDSPYLFYPILEPHGASDSGILTFSKSRITTSERVELPIESGFTKLLDLDRCYSKSRVRTGDGHELVLYNFHLSAYTSDGKIATEQLEIILKDMESEFKNGNYCIAGGDFNKDILGDSSAWFGKADKEFTWAQPIPEGLIEKYPAVLVAPLDKTNPVPSCRNADSAYHDGQLVLTIDGFLVSPNVTVTSSEVIDTAFAYSDHNPVRMTFKLGAATEE